MADGATTASFDDLLAKIKELTDAIREKNATTDPDKLKAAIRDAVKDAATAIPQGRKAAFVQPDDAGAAEAKKTPQNALYQRALTEECRTLQRTADDVYLLSVLTGTPATQLKYWGEYERALTRALGTGVAGEGAEWVPEGFSAELIEEVKLQLKVAALHARITMPQNPYNIPGRKSTATARLGSERGVPSAQGAGSRSVTLSAQKLIAYVDLPYELEEDAIIPVLPLIRDDVVTALAEAQETATINGDTAATHQDADVTAADDARKAWDGYRKLAVAKVDLGTFDIAGLRTLRGQLGKYGVNPAQLAWVCSVAGYMRFLSLGEVLTLDKYGPNATVVTGELGRLDGIPIIVSEFERDDLNATGVYDGTTTNKTAIQLVYRLGFVYGDRRNVLVETDRNVKGQTIDVVASQRLDFKSRYEATEPVVGVGYNVPTT